MKKILIPFSLVLFLIPFAADAQGIGLSGKKFSVFYNLDYRGRISPFLGKSYEVSYYNVLDDEEQSLVKSVINFRHTLNLDYAVSRGTTIGVYLATTRDGYGVERQNGDPAFSKNFISQSAGVQFKFYNVMKKGAIAPLGNYFGLKLGINSTQLNKKANPFTMGEQEPIETDKFTLPAIGFVFGKQIVMYKILMVNVGAEFYIPFGLNFIGISSEVNLLDGKFSDPYRRLLLNDLLRLSIGVGLAPF